MYVYYESAGAQWTPTLRQAYPNRMPATLIQPQKLNELNYEFGSDALIKNRTGINELEGNVSSDSIACDLFPMLVFISQTVKIEQIVFNIYVH